MSLEGDIGEIQLIDRLVELWREQFTGAIRFENDGIIKIVYFKSGDILSASTNDRADSVDEILMRAGKVSREHVKQALAKRKENETLGDALLNLGFITRKELSWARRVQVVGVIRSIASWTSGSYTIVADYLPKRDEGTLFPLPQIVVELVVTEADRQKFEKVMEAGTATFSKSADFEDVFRRLGLNEEAEQIVREIDGTKSANDVAAAAGKDSFNVYKLLHALATLGILQKAQATPQVSAVDEYSFETAGVSDAADMWAPTPEPQPVQQAQPMFDFDEAEAIKAPTLEVPIGSLPDEPGTAPAASAWDDEGEATAAGAWSEPPAEEPAAPAAAMPSWDSPSSPAAAAAVATTATAAATEQWGFDEAQIETARRATAPPSTPAAEPFTPRPLISSRPRRRRSPFAPIVALLLIGIATALAYYGWLWWQQRQDAEAAAAAAAVPSRAARRPQPVAPPLTATTAAPGTASTATTGTLVSAAPTTTAPAATTTIATAAPAVDTTPEKPLPKVVPATPKATAAPVRGDRAYYDAKAREFLSAGGGNFTVQIQILCDPSNLEKAARSGGGNVWWVPQTISGRSCYRVFWGHFATREEAQRAMGSVPADLRDPAMGVKPVPKG